MVGLTDIHDLARKLRESPTGVRSLKVDKFLQKKPNPTTPMSDREFAHLSDDKDRLLVVSMMSRPGAGVFVVDLEYSHFSPGSPQNDEFEMVISKWQGMDWFVMYVPMKYKPLVEQVAKRNGMCLGDGYPTIIGGGSAPEIFPLNGDNVFTLENAPDSPLYKGERNQVMKDQQRRIDKIISDFERTHVDPIEGSGLMSK